MFGRSKKSRYVDRRFELTPEVFVPLRVHEEKRNGYRASIGKKQLIFRMPYGLTETDRTTILDALSKWARDIHQKDPKHFAHLLPKVLPENGTVIVMNEAFGVKISRNYSRNSHFATYASEDPQQINIELSRDLDPQRIGPAVETLISRLSSQRYLPEITRRVDELNDAHFKQDISGVTLKLTKSQWGSCSTKGNINLSSRLLLVPERVREAVIIHELAHRIEMNHSSRFWKLVHDAMPDYDEQHAFLNKHGRELSFLPM